MLEKRTLEQSSGYVALNPATKAKQKLTGQFSLKRKKSKSQLDFGDLLCPFETEAAENVFK